MQHWFAVGPEVCRLRLVARSSYFHVRRAYPPSSSAVCRRCRDTALPSVAADVVVPLIRAQSPRNSTASPDTPKCDFAVTRPASSKSCVRGGSRPHSPPAPGRTEQRDLDRLPRASKRLRVAAYPPGWIGVCRRPEEILTRPVAALIIRPHHAVIAVLVDGRFAVGPKNACSVALPRASYFTSAVAKPNDCSPPVCRRAEVPRLQRCRAGPAGVMRATPYVVDRRLALGVEVGLLDQVAARRRLLPRW
jgi:hypothetical protein